VINELPSKKGRKELFHDEETIRTTVTIPKKLYDQAKHYGLSLSVVLTRCLEEWIEAIESKGIIRSKSNNERLANGGTTHELMGPRPGFEPGPGAPQANNVELIDDFIRFMHVDLNLTNDTIRKHKGAVLRFLKHVDKPIDAITIEDVRSFLEDMKHYSTHHYSNFIKALRRFFRDYLHRPWLIDSFKLPSKPAPIVRIPSKEQLQHFYYSIDSLKHQALFLMYATAGLRRMEVLTLTPDDVNIDERLVYPNKKCTATKRVYVGIFNHECQEVLRQWMTQRRTVSNRLFPIHDKRLWSNARERTGLNITPHVLRKWHASELLRLGMNPLYIDALQGRVPKSILAQHYIAIDVDTLKQAYDEAGLKVLS